jgi:hypothetical protein
VAQLRSDITLMYRIENEAKSFRSHPFHVRLIMMTYIVAFAIGTATHINIILHGWWAPHHPLLNTYWTSLALLDPLTIVLLVRAPRLGMPLALIVMLTDVAINSIASYLYADAGGRYAVNYFVQLQTAYLGFLLGSAPFVWAHVCRQGTA